MIEKMCVYLAKMVAHDEWLAQARPSMQAIGAVYVSLKICE